MALFTEITEKECFNKRHPPPPVVKGDNLTNTAR